MPDPDMLAGLIAYLFREDIRAHPIPPQRAEQLLQTIHCLLSESATELKITKERERAHGQTENDSPGDPGAAERSECPG